MKSPSTHRTIIREQQQQQHQLLTTATAATPMSPRQRNSFAVVGFATLVLLFVLSTTASTSTTTTTAPENSSSNSNSVTGMEKVRSSVHIQSGRTSHNIAFYHCHHHSKNSKQHDHGTELVLLHGSRFTKEEWKTSGIMELFCQSDKDLSVTALDLPVKAPYTKLLETLKDLQREGIVQQLPIAGLVTPSASGNSVLSGIAPTAQAGAKKKGMGSASVATKQLKEAIQRWIPVASNGVLSVDRQALKDKLKDWPILAIYGDQDGQGKRSSKVLLSTAGAAEIQEIKGRHPCYLDSPNDFVEKVLSFVGIGDVQRAP